MSRRGCFVYNKFAKVTVNLVTRMNNLCWILIKCRAYFVIAAPGFPFALTRFGALDNSYFIAKS